MSMLLLQEWQKARSFLKKSCAQVETSPVAKPLAKSGAPARPKRKRVTVSIEYTAMQRDIVRSKAQKAKLSPNAYIKCLTLGPDYDPLLRTALLLVNCDPNGDPYEVGRFWPKQKDDLNYYSVSLESPFFPQPISAALFPDSNDPSRYNLTWKRQKPGAETDDNTQDPSSDQGELALAKEAKATPVKAAPGARPPAARPRAGAKATL